MVLIVRRLLFVVYFVLVDVCCVLVGVVCCSLCIICVVRWLRFVEWCVVCCCAVLVANVGVVCCGLRAVLCYVCYVWGLVIDVCCLPFAI